MRIAVLVDGGFFVRRYPTAFPGPDRQAKAADELYAMALRHVGEPPRERAGNPSRERAGENDNILYRVFVYDCPPLKKRVHRPISNQSLDLSKTPEAIFRGQFHASLVRMRKVALRLGRLDESNAEWRLRPGVLRKLLRGEMLFENLTDDDFVYYAKQKIVDTKIGLDIALLSEKRLVDRIVLVAGDSDFVPAAKHARREGVDFMLDPMWNEIAPDLNEHIDGLWSTAPKPRSRQATAPGAHMDGAA